MTRTRTLAVATSVLATATGPAVLAVTNAWQPPSPTSDDIRQLIASPLSPHLVTTLIGAAAVALWLLLITTLLTHAYATVARRARWMVEIRLPGPIRSLTAALLGASAVTTASGAIAQATPVTSTTDEPASEPVIAVPVPLATHFTATHAPQDHGTAPTHTVRRGDTLSEIAEEALGDDKRWREIFALNRGTHFPSVGGTLRNPNLIFPGWVLTLPAADAPPDATPPRNPPTQDPPRGPTASPPTTATAAPHTATPDSSPTAAPNAPPTARPQPSATSPAVDDGVVEPPSASVSPTPGFTSPATSTTAPGPPSADRSRATAPPGAADDRPSHSLWGWVEIAGGAIGAGLAAALVSAVTMVWRRRRHRYRPTPITSPVLADADLTPPLAALTRLRRGVRRVAPQLLTRTPARGRTVRQDTTAQATPPPPSTAPNDTESAGAGAPAAAAGLGLDGPAALDAVRALMVATLTPDADRPHAHGRVIIPTATLTTLLGVSAADLHPMPGLTVAPTFAAALTLMEEEIIRRSRILADQEAVTVSALPQERTVGEPLPYLLLIAGVPEQSWHPRLATAIHLGTNVDIGTALIGTWPHGRTLTVAADGTTEDGHGERVAVLDPTATTDILRMLAEAHGDTAPATTTPDSAPAPVAPTTTPARHGDTARAAPEKVNPAPQISVSAQDAAPPAPGSTATSGRVRACVLGHPTILDADGKAVRGLRAKSLELFVYLVVHRGGANLDDIMEAIWPDVTVSRASERLSTCAANLRTTIRSIAQTGTGPNDDTPKIEPVINTGGRYHLDPHLLDVDWWTVQDSYARVATAADDADRLAHLHAAIAAARGGLADGSDYEWIDTDREHTRRHLVKIYAQAAGLHLGSDPAAALAVYDTARALDPLSDELTRRAMRTAARLGDAVGVRERLVTLRRNLGDAGIDIDPDTEDLATSLLQNLIHP
ncbi:LysM peptidoglycan-binding domain-containing protein [Micromonospora ureilytica]|uniref:LysM peptidoglycan-binding domain-containing protein n=1 Tax=Micromonospora ureilytica TaxID=709868 RepID=UPI00142D39E7|nr:LysM peptidoglycan-binding domain-containing protein [Micromonospora ureilytica]